MAVNEYLIYAIEQNWIDITSYESEAKYADTEELYNDLVQNNIEIIETPKISKDKDAIEIESGSSPE